MDFEFVDESDPDFDFKALLNEVNEKAEIGHWKAATRKLKKLSRKYATSEMLVPEQTYVSVLEACVQNKLHGARASEPEERFWRKWLTKVTGFLLRLETNASLTL